MFDDHQYERLEKKPVAIFAGTTATTSLLQRNLGCWRNTINQLPKQNHQTLLGYHSVASVSGCVATLWYDGRRAWQPQTTKKRGVNYDQASINQMCDDSV